MHLTAVASRARLRRALPRCDGLVGCRAIGIGLGVLSVATGFGGLVVAAEGADALALELGITSAISGSTDAFLDGRDCVEHPAINATCTAAVLGVIGVGMSLPELGVSAGLFAEPEYQDFLALATGGLFAGYGAVVTDLGHALYDVSKQLGCNQLGPSQKDLCEQA